MRNTWACSGLSSVEITLISHRSLWPCCFHGAKAPPSLIHKHLSADKGPSFCGLGRSLQSTGHRPNGQCYYHAITITACGKELTACSWCALPPLRNPSFLCRRTLLHLSSVVLLFAPDPHHHTITWPQRGVAVCYERPSSQVAFAFQTAQCGQPHTQVTQLSRFTKLPSTLQKYLNSAKSFSGHKVR